MKKFLVFITLILSFAFDANAAKQNKTGDETSEVMCSIVKYTQSIGGPMITAVIIGAALLAIFGRMPWPALFALGAFTAVFFGAPAVVSALMGGSDKLCPDTQTVIGPSGGSGSNTGSSPSSNTGSSPSSNIGSSPSSNAGG